MKIKKDCVIITLEEKDFKSLNAIKGTAIDVLIIPNELKNVWMDSELRLAFIPMLNKNAEIFYK